MIDKLSLSFNKDGYAVADLSTQLPDLSETATALNALPEENWFYIIKNSQLELDFRQEQRDEIRQNYLLARNDYEAGRFSFAFSRIVVDESTRENPSIDYLYRLFTDNILSMMRDITGRDLKKLSVFYITRFDKGDFLTTHCDSGNSVGVVINMTQQWKPEFGGLTVLLPSNKEDFGKLLMPKLGQTFMFDVCERKILHFVSEVTSHQSSRRISIVARYDE